METITTITGELPTNTSKIILIHGPNLVKLLKRLAKTKTSSIWEYDRKLIDPILKQHNLIPKMFLQLGHVYYDSNRDIDSLILANRSICEIPQRFIVIDRYGDYDIVKPISDMPYEALGLLCITSNIDLDDIGLLPKGIISTEKSDMNLTANIYNLLSSKKTDINTINLSIFLSYDKQNIKTNMKFVDINGNYLTAVDGELKTKTKMSNASQTFRYNAQGELIIDDKCLTVDKFKSKINLDSCSGDEHQEWLLTSSGSIKSKKDDLCLSTESDNVSVMACNNSSDNQDWNIENDDTNATAIYTWDKYKGKTVVLVESDDPWYVNKDTTIRQPYPKSEYNVSDLHYRDNADYESDFILDQDSHSLGMGHSYADHNGVSCNKEGFGDVSTSNQIIFYLCILLVILMIYRYSK